MAPAVANDEPPATKTFAVTRGGQTFQRTTFETELAPDGRLMRAGSFIVKFRARSGVDQEDAHRLAGALGIERLFSGDAVRVQVGRARTWAALLAYRAHPAVERVEPDYVARVVEAPDDPRYAEQWGMKKIRAGSTTDSEQSAWNVSMSNPNTRIAVLDCGVYNEDSSSYLAPDGQRGHPDLRATSGTKKVIDNKNFTTAPDADDYCNHGTHVAGIAAANTNNTVGVAGVGYAASIVNVKVLGDNGSGSFAWIINGILWAAGCEDATCVPRRADIINMSLGATGSCTASMQAAIDKAWTQGLVIVAAAGNAGASGAITPANCNHVIGVSASDQNDARASFSNYGSGVDVAAPGVGILSSDYVGGYSSFNGTSMASPHVAGLAALVWTTEHNTSSQAVVDRISCTANEQVKAGSTNGRIDAYAAVLAGPCTPAPVPPSLSIGDVSASEGDTNTTSFTFTVSRTGDTTQTATVSFATSNGSASSPTDYTAASGSLTFAPGETTNTISVQVNGDTTRESNETFNVNLSNAVNATIADGTGVGTILNDDLPAITISDVSRTERNSGTRSFSFTVRLSASSNQTVNVTYATVDGTANGDTTCSFDYLTSSGTLSFSSGTTSRTVSVSVCGDRANESNETFLVVLSNAVNATIADSEGVGTIQNDD